ncbi:hypothetical protein AR438_14345 [Chryseobacterium aquaticum]|uniref:Uncharacterized protein n=2 Tax=Chryseobacterium aquaticum TaxID=452084 RepID=A0A0Q3KKZ2_9FLAO|nr:hypothetical protein AR438_14345 [Chryseobacterium aquaticum]
MKEPENFQDWKEQNSKVKKVHIIFSKEQIEKFKLYEKAKKKILFEGFTVAYNGYSVIRIVASYDETIDISFKKDLTPQIPSDVESLTVYDVIYLSQTSLKLIGIKK